ncbi:MAG: ABC transporter permease [Armatimonadetes bacterium]|nr:ABC transporter permease [Armatimonadota bacterium]
MKLAIVVFKKEFREMMRDRRVVFGAFVMPFVVVFMMIQLFGFIGSSIQKTVKKQEIFVVKPAAPNSLYSDLQMVSKSIDPKVTGGAEFKITEIESVAAGRKLIEDGKAKYVLSFPADFDAKVTVGKATVDAYYDSGTETSGIALSTFDKIVDAKNKEMLKLKLATASISADQMEPIKVERKDIAKKEGLSGSMLVGLLPYLMIVFAFVGGMSVVSDLVAGEKERGTLETLLISPVTRRDIALGKFFSLSVVSFLSAISMVLSLVVIGASGMAAGKMLFPEGSGLNLSMVLTLLGVLLPLVFFFSGMMLAISAFAKNMREAQTYLGIANFVVITPAVFSQVLGFTDLSQAIWIKFVPVLNTALVIRGALLGKPDMQLMGITVFTSLVLAAIGFGLVLKMFTREQILARI